MLRSNRLATWTTFLVFTGFLFVLPVESQISSTRTKTEPKVVETNQKRVNKSEPRKAVRKKVSKKIPPPPAPIGPADLKVVSVRIEPGEPEQYGKPAKFAVRVQNIGYVATLNKCSLNMSVWSVKYNNHELVPGKTHFHNVIRHDANNIPKLEPGETITIYKRLPSTFRFFGWHMVFGYINAAGIQIGNEIQDNNRYEKVFHVTPPPPPDLVICSKMGIVSPIHAKSWYPVRIRNIGAGRSPSCKLSFWIEDKGTKTYTIPPLQTGEEYSKTRSVHWAKSGARDFQIRIGCPVGGGEKTRGNIFNGCINVKKSIQFPAQFDNTRCRNSEIICTDDTQYEHTPFSGEPVTN